jgi:tetratricopeptide (TPR) repeat protein
MDNPLENDIGFMEAYLTGTMLPNEKNAFENRLETDKAFAEEFMSFRTSYQAIILQSRKELKEHLKGLEKNKTSEAKIINWRYVSLAVAASLSLAILIINLLSSPSTDDLYKTYYSVYPNVVAPIERSTQIAVDSYKKPFQLYEDARYEEALLQFNELLQTKPTSPALNLYAGFCALALKDSKTAIAYFEVVINNPPNDFLATARWYSALAYLQEENKEQAMAMLVQLKQNHFYRERAGRLLQDLE